MGVAYSIYDLEQRLVLHLGKVGPELSWLSEVWDGDVAAVAAVEPVVDDDARTTIAEVLAVRDAIVGWARQSGVARYRVYADCSDETPPWLDERWRPRPGWCQTVAP